MVGFKEKGVEVEVVAGEDRRFIRIAHDRSVWRFSGESFTSTYEVGLFPVWDFTTELDFWKSEFFDSASFSAATHQRSRVARDSADMEKNQQSIMDYFSTAGGLH
jgi:hypothetical protein